MAGALRMKILSRGIFFLNPLGIYRGAKETRQTIALSHRTHLASVSKG